MAKGCGPHWLPKKFHPPFFKEDCEEHDDCYDKSGYCRKTCDRRFLLCMLRRARPNKFRVFQAYLFYYLVRIIGWSLYRK